MAGSLNRAQIIGHLGRDPEVRHLNSGAMIVSMRVATSENWRDKRTGERVERTEWHSVVIFNEGLAKVADQYLRKGDKVMIEGQLQTRKWQDQNGVDRYTTEIAVKPFVGSLLLLGSPKEENNRGRRNEPRRALRSETPVSRDDDEPPPYTEAPSYAEELDDEIPF